MTKEEKSGRYEVPDHGKWDSLIEAIGTGGNSWSDQQQTLGYVVAFQGKVLTEILDELRLLRLECAANGGDKPDGRENKKGRRKGETAGGND